MTGWPVMCKCLRSMSSHYVLACWIRCRWSATQADWWAVLTYSTNVSIRLAVSSMLSSYRAKVMVRVSGMFRLGLRLQTAATGSLLDLVPGIPAAGTIYIKHYICCKCDLGQRSAWTYMWMCREERHADARVNRQAQRQAAAMSRRVNWVSASWQMIVLVAVTVNEPITSLLA